MTPMGANLATVDPLFRGAAAALLVFLIIHALFSRLPALQRGLFVTFELSILAYLLCTTPVIGQLPISLWIVALSLCFVAAPLLWLVARTAFEDHFAWKATNTIYLAAAWSMGWMATLGVGGVAVGIAQKILLISFAVASIWTVLKDWQSDLVSRRRQVRAWVACGLATYVLLVLSSELLYIRSGMPTWLMAVNLVCISSIAEALALAFAWYPLDEWFNPHRLFDTVSMVPRREDGSGRVDSLAECSLAAAARVSPNAAPSDLPRLTIAPPPVDRRAALRERLLGAMREQRVYATEGLTLTELAASLNATPAQLRETINRHLGYRNFNDFLNHYRVDDSSQRLLVQDLPILTIALDVGYGSLGPFNRAFKQIKGMTPTEFRLRERE